MESEWNTLESARICQNMSFQRIPRAIQADSDVVWWRGGTVVGTHLVSSNQRQMTNAIRHLVVLICGWLSSYARVCCCMWAAVFIHGRVISVCGRPFSYAGISFSSAGVSFSGEGSCLRMWAVVFVRGQSSLGHMVVVVCCGHVDRQSLSSWDW
jgi:hypothetical protein